MRKAEKYVEALIKSRQIRRRGVALILVLSLAVSGNVFWLTRAHGTALADDPICGIEEHTHGEECYEKELVCEEDHEHEDSCYEQKLICGLEEHTHSEGCYIDLASREEPADWEKGLPKLSNDPSADLLRVAVSQTGYEEGLDGYTRYGAWYGNETGEWNLMFVSFCLHYAGIKASSVPYGSGAWAWQVKLKDKGLLTEDISSIKPGIIMLVDSDQDGKCDRAGILADMDKDQYILIEGDVDGKVSEVRYKAEDGVFLGYVSADPADTAPDSSQDQDIVSSEPSGEPEPTVEPTAEPTAEPIAEPTAEPTPEPTVEPTAIPTAEPTEVPAQEPEDMVFDAKTKSGIKVHVSVTSEAFDSAVTMTAKDVDEKDILDDAEKMIDEDKKITGTVAVDISFIDPDGNEVEPKEGYSVDVKIEVPKALQPEGEDFSLLHFGEDGVTEVEDADVSKKGAEFTTESFSIYVLTGTGEKDKDHVNAFIAVAFGTDMTPYLADGGTGDTIRNCQEFPYMLRKGDTVVLVGRMPEGGTENLHFDYLPGFGWFDRIVSIEEISSSPTEVIAVVTGLSNADNNGQAAVTLYAGTTGLDQNFSIKVTDSFATDHVIDFDSLNNWSEVHVKYGDTITFRGTPNPNGENWPYITNDMGLLTLDYDNGSTEGNGVRNLPAKVTGFIDRDDQVQEVNFWTPSGGKTIRVVVDRFHHSSNIADTNSYDDVLDHADIEIADGGVYTNVSFEVGDDDGMIKTVTEYQSYVSKVNTCRIYNKDINEHNDNPTDFFLNNNGVYSPYSTNGYNTDEYSSDPSFMPGDSQYELTSKWNGIADYLYRDVDHVVFDVGMQIVPTKVEKYRFDPSTKQWVLLADQTEEYVIDYNSKTYSKSVGGTSVISGGPIADIMEEDDSTIFDLGTRYVIDAYNKCPNHTGLDFTVHANNASVQFGATKKLTNGRLQGDDFTFELVDRETGVVVSRTNDINGKVMFDRIEYDAAGVHHYYIREVDQSADKPNIVFDDSVYDVTVTVDVIPNSGGMLIANVKELDDNYSFKFKNSVKVTLPDTGGEGIIPYIAGGLVLIAAALFLIIMKKRKGVDE